MANKIVTRCPHCGKPFSQTAQTFESSTDALDLTPAHPRESIWADSARYLTWLSLGSGASWLALAMAELRDPPYWLAPISGLCITLAIEWAKIWLSRPVTVLPKPDHTTVRLEVKSPLPSGSKYELADFDPVVTIEDLAKVARAGSFSRSAATKAGLSQSKWHKVKDEFIRLNLAYSLPNNQNGYGLTLRGKALLRAIPYPTESGGHPNF